MLSVINLCVIMLSVAAPIKGGKAVTVTVGN